MENQDENKVEEEVIDKYESIYKIDKNVEYILPKFANITDKTFCMSESIDPVEFAHLISEKREYILNDDSEMLYELHKQIYPIDKIKHDILTFEFIYGKTDKICNTLEETIILLQA